MPAIRTNRRKVKRSHPYARAGTVVRRYENMFLGSRSRLRGPWPDSFTTQLRYYDTFSVNPAAGGITTQVMRANSVFDPDFTGAGHQPRGYDQWTAMYSKYVVLAARIKVEAMFSLTGNSGKVYVSANTSAAPYGSDLDVMEDNRVKSKTLSQFERATIYETYQHKDFFISNPIDDDNAGSVTGGNPVNTAYFIVGATCLNAAQDPGDFTVMVTIDYKVRFYDHVEPADS